MSAALTDEHDTKEQYTDGIEPVSAHVLGVAEGELDKKELQQAEELIVAAEHEFSEQDFKRLRMKFSLIIVPIISMIYGLAYTDKTSLSSGVVFSLYADTGLNSTTYANLTVWFYLSYLIGQTPMTYALQRWSLGRGLGLTATAWGITLIGIGACNNYAQLSVTRTMLGWFECSLTTGYFLLIASWYTRMESTFVNSLFLSMNQLVGGAFGVFLYLLAKHSLDDGGVAGWRLMNYFLGAVTAGFGILSLIFVGLPDEVWWLTKREKRMVHARIIGNGSTGGEKRAWDWGQVKEAFKDPQMYFVIVFNMLTNIPNGVTTTFGTLVTKGFGFTSLQSVLYSQPANAIGFVCTISTSYIVMKYPRSRFPLCVMWTVVATICYMYIGIAEDANKWRKWAAYSMRTVSGAPVYLIWPLVALNVTGRTKRSVMGIAQFITYCVGNMVGAVAVPSGDAPGYHKTLIICAVLYVAKSICIAVWWAYYLWENKRRDKAQQAAGINDEEREHANMLAGQLDQTDIQNQNFRYSA